MREIKFRAWDKLTRIIVPYEEMSCHKSKFEYGRRALLSGFLQNPDYEVMQFTGLKDKNGVDIYEGDIMRFGIGETLDEMIVGDVYWENVSFQLRHPKGYHGRFALRQDYIKIANMEVIGNIYQDAHLLNK